MFTFKSLADFDKAFPDENAAINHYRAIRWPDGNIVCPSCGVASAKHYTLKNNTHKCVEPKCGKKFSVRKDSIFDSSNVPLRKWFMAIFLMTSHKKGISSCQLARDIGVGQKAAWFMLHRIRNATMTPEFKAPLNGVVELDEAYVGGQSKWKHANKKINMKRGKGAANEKKIVFGMLQREGELRVAHIPDTRLATTKAVILANIEKGTRIMSDEANTFIWMREQYIHRFVAHSLGEYVRGAVTTNRIENVFSHFKRSIVGVYHKASDKHLDAYLQMFAYRWNRRDMRDSDRVNDLLEATKGRRLTYKQLVH
jgi:transposase-like protein